jgi:hypothetical protein
MLAYDVSRLSSLRFRFAAAELQNVVGFGGRLTLHNAGTERGGEGAVDCGEVHHFAAFRSCSCRIFWRSLLSQLKYIHRVKSSSM